ncbi:hypothetical protein MANES_15G133050v8 [Manihot esculenta]|uniref:Uncharacterized protein n=1 Tax=Manihot esculenta TaxID=3983 RepID=A0ACB7GCD8_MANES|nr:hypothetical protein MANES_15G133050v8 [Manihot esculenta]
MQIGFVSKTLRSAANSDALWEKFLPSNCEILSSLSFSSKKELSLSLCNNPDLIHNNKKLGCGRETNTAAVCLQPDKELGRVIGGVTCMRRPNRRNDGRLEIELGEYFNHCHASARSQKWTHCSRD